MPCVASSVFFLDNLPSQDQKALRCHVSFALDRLRSFTEECCHRNARVDAVLDGLSQRLGFMDPILRRYRVNSNALLFTFANPDLNDMAGAAGLLVDADGDLFLFGHWDLRLLDDFRCGRGNSR